jgi:Flp pilus assembly protein TadB
MRADALEKDKLQAIFKDMESQDREYREKVLSAFDCIVSEHESRIKLARIASTVNWLLLFVAILTGLHVLFLMFVNAIAFLVAVCVSYRNEHKIEKMLKEMGFPIDELKGE